MAGTSVLFVGWNKPQVGREGEALETFNGFLNYLGQQQNQGTIDSFEPVLLSPHGGDLGGFILVRGDRGRLDELRRTEPFVDQTTRANYQVRGFGVVDGWIGDGMKGQLQRYAKLIRR